VLRRRVKDLPLSFTLTTAPVSPAATLSGASRRRQRISRAATRRAPGDLQGLPIAVGESGIAIEINEEVK
jgi:hypothetical protein